MASSRIPSHDAVTVLASSRAVIDNRLTAATIVISHSTGKITAVHTELLPSSHFPDGTLYVDHSPHVLMPGLVDTHVHLNEPGRTEWEGFWTGTRAAAFGGVTTVIDMPLNAIPPTTTVQGLREKIKAAEGQCWIDVGFYGGIVPGNQAELKGLVNEGVRGFKGFLIDSGVSDDPIACKYDSPTNDRCAEYALRQVPEFPAVSSEDVAVAMKELADAPTTLMFHAEMLPSESAIPHNEPQASQTPPAPPGPSEAYSTFLASRPPSFETHAIEQIIALAHNAPNLPLHIVHLSALEAIPILRAARRRGVRITAETCFHYLALAAEGVPEGDTRHKCCPPIRAQSNQDALWTELTRPTSDQEGSDASVIQTVVSDHSPCTPNLKLLPLSIAGSNSSLNGDKRGDFFAAWGGVSSVGLGLPILWTEAYYRGLVGTTVTLPQIAKWCSVNTARQVGLQGRKGTLAAGLDADIAVFDDEAEWKLNADRMLWRNKCSPYEGKWMKGRVIETWLRGKRVWNGRQTEGRTIGDGFEGNPAGELLLDRREI